jgi:hypothetical protein
MQMVNGEIHRRNCGVNGSTIPVFIEKYKNHRKCIKIVPIDDPCLGRVQDQHFVDLLFLQNITFQSTRRSAACSKSSLVHVLPIKSSYFT